MPTLEKSYNNKTLENKVGYRLLYGRLPKIWNLSGSFELIDLQNDFFLVKFYEQVDYERVMYEGLWMILGHYLTVQRWKPKFRPFEESIKKIAAWICIPDLPIEYYDKHLLWKLGNKVGKTLKVDVHTIRENKNGGELNTTEIGRFARISVELNLNKMFIPRVSIRNNTYRIEYEGLNLICFICGRYGHHKETCPTTTTILENQTVGEDNNHNLSNTYLGPAENTTSQLNNKEEVYGSWMIVKRNNRNNKPNKNQTYGNQGRTMEQLNNTQPDLNTQVRPNGMGSRFAIFETEEESLEKQVIGEEQRERLGDDSIVSSGNLMKKNIEATSVIEETNQKTSSMNMTIQHGYHQYSEQGANVSMLKRKNIMEKFIKTKGKEKNSNTGTLKTNSAGIFKQQKPKKLSEQREKAKTLITTT